MSIAVSVIVPVLNETAVLPALLAQLKPLNDRADVEVLLVDGGSVDGTPESARSAGLSVFDSAPGRARQMNLGARHGAGALLLFLHADTRLPALDVTALIEQLVRSGKVWGRFDAYIDGRSWVLPLVARLMNWRSRLNGIATGDQAMFVLRDAFERVGGFPEQPLMEDIELSRRLKRLSRPLCLKERIITSGRQWDQRGAWRTIVLMWRLRWAYWRGAEPAELLRRYRYRD